VIGVHGDLAEVRSRTLIWDGADLTLGSAPTGGTELRLVVPVDAEG